MRSHEGIQPKANTPAGSGPVPPPPSQLPPPRGGTINHLPTCPACNGRGGGFAGSLFVQVTQPLRVMEIEEYPHKNVVEATYPEAFGYLVDAGGALHIFLKSGNVRTLPAHMWDSVNKPHRNTNE